MPAATDDAADHDALLAELTLGEKCRLLGGASTWRTHAVERLGIPALKMTDGPNGARGESQGARRTRGVAVPVGIALGATWDPELLAEVGELLGREAVRKGAHVLLAPTVNLQRTPVGGRVFECLSEDPELSAQLAAALVRGVQANDVAVTVKHLVANDTERDRMSVDVRVEPRALHELYLRPFEAAVVDGGAWGVMSAYNRLEGEFCAGNRDLLTGVLVERWGFDGFVVSDWLGAHDTVPSATAGLTVPMPGPGTIYGEPLQRAVEAGEVDEATVDELVRRLLRLVDRTRARERSADRPEQTVDDPAERALCRRAAAAGTVLVRNEGGVLPLAADGPARIAVVGPNAAEPRTMGGGSASLASLPTRSLLAALTARVDAEVVHEPGVRIDKMAPLVGRRALRTPDGAEGLRIEYVDGLDLDGEAAVTDVVHESAARFFGSTPDGVDPERFVARLVGSFVPEVDGPHELGLVVTGNARLRVDGEVVVDDPDRSLPRSDAFFGLGSEEQLVTVEATAGEAIQLEVATTCWMGFGAVRLGVRRPDPADLLERAVAAAAEADVAVVVAGTNDEWETEGHDRDTIHLPGDQDELIARVAAANPRTVVVVNAGSPVAMPWLSDVAAVVVPFFGGMEMGDAVVDVLLGEVDPGGRLPVTYPVRLEDTPSWEHYLPVDGVQTYGEGLLMGYRGFEAAGTVPLLPFGHGLSYGAVAWGMPEQSTRSIGAEELADGGEVVVTVPVACEGDRPGTEVVQGYVAAVDPVVERPPKELRAFAKVELSPGEQADAVLRFGHVAFRRFDPDADGGRGDWVVDPGTYELVLGSSSADERVRLSVELT